MSHKPRWRAIKRARHARFRRESVLARRALKSFPSFESASSETIFITSLILTGRPPNFYEMRRSLLDSLEDDEDSEKIREILTDTSKPFIPALAKLLEEVLFPPRQS